MTGAIPTPSSSSSDENILNKYQLSWEPAAAQRIAFDLRNNQHEVSNKNNRPCMVSVVGIPGGGKSVSSLLLAKLLDEIGISSVIMPHDGYHYPIKELKLFPDARDMIYRRGAPDTFDSQALLRDLGRIRDGQEEVIVIPGFDHGKGDPEWGAHFFDRTKHQVVIVEGLYLLHDQDGWKDVANFFDLNIFIESDVDDCVERLKVRNLCIPGYTPEEIQVRCEEVDRTNAMTVMRSKHRADLVVQAFIGTTSQKPTSPTFRPERQWPEVQPKLIQS